MPGWLAQRLRTPCTVYVRINVGEDEYGNVTYGEVATSTMCFFTPAGQDEIQDGRAQVGSYLLHLPDQIAGVLDGFARVVVHGISYEAIGPPAIYPSLITSGVHHVEVNVQRSTA